MSENVGKVYNLSGYGKVLADIIHDLGEKVDQTALDSALQAKQNTLIGTAGQMVGFDEEGHAIATEAPQTGLTQEEADELYMPFEDPGFLGMLWSQDEEGNGVQVMAGYDDGSTKTTYVTVYETGASADMGVVSGDTPISYMTLMTTETGGSVQAKAGFDYSEVALFSPGGNDGQKKTAIFAISSSGIASEYGPKVAHARLMFEDKEYSSAKSAIDFYKRSDGKIRVAGLADPENSDEAANKKYVDEHAGGLTQDEADARYVRGIASDTVAGPFIVNSGAPDPDHRRAVLSERALDLFTGANTNPDQQDWKSHLSSTTLWFENGMSKYKHGIQFYDSWGLGVCDFTQEPEYGNKYPLARLAVKDPENSYDATTKKYVDEAIQKAIQNTWGASY